MIGQINLQKQISQFIENNTFPRFSIFVGPRGSGKKTFIHECVIKEVTDGLYEECGTKIDDVRELIHDAYQIHSLAVYFIPDADNMSNAAKNALLKVTEEPPNNAYFIMTLEDENNTLETIRSRGTVFHMDRYTPDEISNYYGDNYFNEDDAYWSSREVIVKELCETPGEVDMLAKDILLFYDYVQLVVDHIDETSIANSFKIADKLALKEDSDGYDIKLFWKAFIKVCASRVNENLSQAGIMKYVNWITITSRHLDKLRIRGLNRQMLFDDWIMSIRSMEE